MSYYRFKDSEYLYLNHYSLTVHVHPGTEISLCAVLTSLINSATSLQAFDRSDMATNISTIAARDVRPCNDEQRPTSLLQDQ